MFFFAVPPWLIYLTSAMLTIWCLASLWLFWTFTRYIKAKYDKIADFAMSLMKEEEEAEDKPQSRPNLIILNSDEVY